MLNDFIIIFCDKIVVRTDKILERLFWIDFFQFSDIKWNFVSLVKFLNFLLKHTKSFYDNSKFIELISYEKKDEKSILLIKSY